MSTDTTDAARPSTRTFALVLIGMSIAVWWPVFTLGAWGELFFDQLLTVWVVSIAGLVVVLAQPRGRRRWGRVIALSIPSLWLALSFATGTSDGDLAVSLVELLGIAVGLVGIPFTLWSICRIVWPELFSELRLRARFGVLLTVVAIAGASFLLGTSQALFLTCDDFTISGNSEPPGCVTPPAD
ncbi:hypothetical protein [Microbacterium sp. 1.5R]|uniref:hypothetical protein n=1 Tax=Microbacterium sp. 1.5R TaxID=1916917 RepID=UPI0021B398AA|nr:hypothetical protein [Microbacterium sp. 1.5R]